MEEAHVKRKLKYVHKYGFQLAQLVKSLIVE